MDLEKIIQIVSEATRIPAGEISEDTYFFEDLCADSLELFRIYTEIIEALDADYKFEDFVKVKTVGSLYDLINR